jgi:hypothetical protein
MTSSKDRALDRRLIKGSRRFFKFQITFIDMAVEQFQSSEIAVARQDCRSASIPWGALVSLTRVILDKK